MNAFLTHIKKYAIQYSLTVIFVGLLAFLTYSQPDYLASLVGDVFRATGTTTRSISTGSSSGSSGSSNYGVGYLDIEVTPGDTGYDDSFSSDSSDDTLDIGINYPDLGEESYDVPEGYTLEVTQDAEGEYIEGYTLTDDYTVIDETPDGGTLFSNVNGVEEEVAVTVIYPNGGEKFTKGDVVNIEWKHADPTISNLFADIYLVQSDQLFNKRAYKKIETWVRGEKYEWKVEEDYEGSYQIVVTAKRAWTEKGSDASDRPFEFYVPHELTRAEVVKVIVEQYEFPMDEDYTNPYSDLDEKSEYYNYITAAYSAGLIDVDSSEEFNPDEFASSEWLLNILAKIDLRPSAPETGVLSVSTNITNGEYDIYNKETGEIVISVRPTKEAFYYLPAGEYSIEYGVTNYEAPNAQVFSITPKDSINLIGNY